MRLTFLGKECNPTESPTLYATDRDSYVVQGWKVDDPELLTRLDVADGKTIIEVPASLFNHLINDGVAGAVTACAPPIMHVTGTGNYILHGTIVSDADALGQMAISDHEDCIEICKAAIKALLDIRGDRR